MAQREFSAIRRQMDSTDTNSCTTCGSWWRLPLLLALVLVAILLSRGRQLWEGEHIADSESATSSTTAPVRQAVSLSIDFGDGRRKDVAAVDWHEGMTVANVMRKTPGVSIAQKGSGAGAFATAIDGVGNEGADGNNWTYEVNGKSGDRSFALYELHPGDRVLWTFGPIR